MCSTAEARILVLLVHPGQPVVVDACPGLVTAQRSTSCVCPHTGQHPVYVLYPCCSYASFEYEEGEAREAELVRVDVLAHGKTVDALARLVHRWAVAGWGG